MKSCRPFDQDSCSSLRLRQSAQEPALPTKTLVHPKTKAQPRQDSGLSECVGQALSSRVLCLLTDHRPRKSRGCDKKHRKSNSRLKAEDRRTAFCPIALARCYRNSLWDKECPWVFGISPRCVAVPSCRCLPQPSIA